MPTAVVLLIFLEHGTYATLKNRAQKSHGWHVKESCVAPEAMHENYCSKLDRWGLVSNSTVPPLSNASERLTESQKNIYPRLIFHVCFVDK